MRKELSAETFHLYLSGAPWIRLLLPFGCGIMLGLAIPPGAAFFFEEMYALLAFLLLGYLLSLYDKNGLGLRKWIPGGLAMLFLYCAGFQLARAEISLHRSGHFSKQTWSHLLVQVQTAPEKRGKYLRFKARVLLGKPDRAHTGIPVSGLLQVYLQPKIPAAPEYGDRLWIAARYGAVPPLRNPGAFDYRAYLAARDIYHRVFLSAAQWTATGENRGNPLIRWAFRVQQHCAEIFDRLLPDGDNAALLSAFVLGYRAGISEETVSAFSDTGTIHILSVSGLHVAILYWLIDLLLKPIALLRGGRSLQLVLTICVIFCYALISGLSPPVCRAAWMLVMLVIARFFGKSYKSENILALTAFLLLANNPLLLADVGFQLSFLAVTGLIYFYPPLNRLYPGLKRHRPQQAPRQMADGGAAGRAGCFRSFCHFPGLDHLRRFSRTGKRLGLALLKIIWSMVAVSLAAQLATFPLSVYYFHQFPVYFLPANLLLIPLSSLILYGGMLLLAVSGSGGTAFFLAGTLSWLLDIMKRAMHFFGELPAPVLRGLWITPFECGSLFLLIIAGGLFLRYRKTGCLLIFLCVCCYLAASAALEEYRQNGQARLVFFHMSDQTVIGFFAGKSAVLIVNREPDPRQYSYAVRPLLRRSGIEDLQIIRPDQPVRKPYLAKRGGYIEFFDLRLLLVDDNFSYPAVDGEVLPCDLLLITENTYLQTDKIERNFRVKMLVSGANVSRALDSYLEGYCHRKNIGFYSISRSGAYILDRATQYEF